MLQIKHPHKLWALHKLVLGLRCGRKPGAVSLPLGTESRADRGWPGLLQPWASGTFMEMGHQTKSRSWLSGAHVWAREGCGGAGDWYL